MDPCEGLNMLGTQAENVLSAAGLLEELDCSDATCRISIPDVVRDKPEYELIKAVFRQGIDDLFLYMRLRQKWARTSKTTRKIIRSAAEWAFSNEESWPTSFNSCCFMLGYNPDYVRRRLLERGDFKALLK